MFDRNKYSKKQSYEFCNIENLMVKIDFIEATITMDDGACADVKLVPTGCNRADICRKKALSCVITTEGGDVPFDT